MSKQWGERRNDNRALVCSSLVSKTSGNTPGCLIGVCRKAVWQFDSKQWQQKGEKSWGWSLGLGMSVRPLVTPFPLKVRHIWCFQGFVLQRLLDGASVSHVLCSTGPAVRCDTFYASKNQENSCILGVFGRVTWCQEIPWDNSIQIIINTTEHRICFLLLTEKLQN